MIVEKTILLLLPLLAIVMAGDDHLIKIGEKQSCIKQVITVFVANKNCNALDDAAKSNLALKMTECLLQQMGKALPSQCQKSSVQACKLEGDAWNTYSTFFAHIDNLCHFYWEMLHHQRAEQLIGQLSQSSQNAETLLRKNAIETEKILIIQQTMHISMEESLNNQKQMTRLINDSARHISNLTSEMESFVRRIHQDINQNYGAVRNILDVMNSGLNQALSVQSYMTAELSSIRGTLYFLCHFLLLLFITSFPRFSHARIASLAILATNLLSEVALSSLIDGLVGTHRFRYLFIILEVILMGQNGSKKNDFEEAISVHLNTPRLKSVFRKVIVENEAMAYRLLSLSSLPNRQSIQLASIRQGLGNQSLQVQ